MSESNSNVFIIKSDINQFKYFPEDIIEGLIDLKPSESLVNKIISDDILIKISLIQKISYYCEEYDLTYETISHFHENKINLIAEEINNYDYLKGYSINYGLNIPIKFKIPKIEKENNLLPSFRFIETNFQCYVSHHLNIEIKDKSNICTTNIFIKKPKMVNENKLITVFKDEIIKKYLLFNQGRLSYYIETFNYCCYNDSLPIEIHLDKTDLNKIKLKSIELNINKNISFKDIKFSLNKIISKKEIMISNIKSNKIKEKIAINKSEFPEIPLNFVNNELFGEIDNNILKEIKKYNYSPPMDNIFFNCCYTLKIIFIFEENFIQNRITEIPIDYYDEEYKNKNKEQMFEQNLAKLNNEKNNKKNIDESKLLSNGFTLLTKEDFINLIDGKK